MFPNGNSLVLLRLMFHCADISGKILISRIHEVEMPKKLRAARIEGNLAFIPLTRGKEAVVDIEDLPLVGKLNWCAFTRNGNIFYAARARTEAEGSGMQYMHRLIMGANDGKIVDHIDRNGLNNTRSNLRFASKSENARNSTKRRNNASGYKGVSWSKKSRTWRAALCVNGNKMLVEGFQSAEEARDAYFDMCLRHHGEFARLE